MRTSVEVSRRSPTPSGQPAPTTWPTGSNAPPTTGVALLALTIDERAIILDQLEDPTDGLSGEASFMLFRAGSILGEEHHARPTHLITRCSRDTP